MCPAVAVVGSGPSTEAVVAALSDADADDDQPAVTVERRSTPDFGDADFGVVIDRVGTDRFGTADDAAVETGTPWIAVELGGVGGYPVVTASVAGFDPARECYDCLAARVEANVEQSAEPTDAPDSANQRLAGALAGRAAVEYLTTDGDAGVLGHVTELPYGERRFLPVPGCRCDSGRELRPRRGHEAVDVDGALARAEQGLDDRVGIAAQVGEVDSYPAPYYLAELSDTSGFSDVTAPRKAAGVATDWNAAFMKALGESYERYAAGVYRQADTTTARAAELPAYVPPSSFVAPEEPAWDDATEFEWAPAAALASGEETHVPAELVFHPPRDASVRPPLTTGLGLGTSPDGALLSGLYEVVERDAAMLSWYSTFDPLGLTVDDETFQTLARRAGAEGLDVTPLLLTQDVDVPVVAVAVHREEWPRFAVGSAARLDPARAARGALEEALQNWMELGNMGPDRADEASGAIAEYAELPDAARDLLAVEQTVPVDSVGPAQVPAESDELDALVDRVVDAGLSPYATRTTTRDLEAIGFEAVRVLVPSAQPLFFGDAFFGERAASVPRELGFEPRPERAHHPFP